MDCSHGGHPGFPPEELIPSSTGTFLMNDNLMTSVPPTPVLLNLLELSLEDNSITTLERSPFRLRPNLQILRLGGNKITNVVSGAFDGLSQLLKLYLNRNNIETVEAFSGIDSPSSLEMLDLQGNKLTSIAISMFTGVPLLTELNLSSNNISTIEDGSFSGLKKLRVLYLHSNQILRLTNETFMGLSSLKSLVLANNKIQNLPDMVFNGAIALEFLDLVSNGISKITRKTFSGLFNLTALSLDSNNISTVEDGAFRDLVKLHTLSLFTNSLQDISASTFIGLAPDDRTDNTGLEVLYVSRNRLTAVRREDFARLTKLSFLTLFDNEITSEGLEDGSFANLGNLVFLSLYGNRLTNISAATFQGLTALRTLLLGGNQFQSFNAFAFANLPALTTLLIPRNPFSSASLHPDVFGNLTAVQYLDIAGVKSLSPRVFRHLPCLQTVTFGFSLTCDCDILALAKWLNKTDVKAERYVTSSQPVACYNPQRLRGRPLSNLRQEDLQMSCPTTTDPPPTESTVQTCPTSLTTEVMTSPRPVTTPSSTTPPSSSFTTRKPGTCTAPTDITVQNVQDSRAEISWLHDGKSINVDLTGFIIEYQIFGQKSWKDTQKVHADERYFTMVDVVPSTPYQACVAVLCKGKNIQAGKDHCVPFTTKMRSTTIVGLAVGIPLLLVILCLVAAVAIALKKRGPFSSKHEAGHSPERPQLQEDNHSKADAAVRPDRENRYQNAGFEEKQGVDGITSSYLDLGKAGDVLNSAGPPAHIAEAPVVPETSWLQTREHSGG
ncbi:PREDICTED: insulin-like growth factor-binding protein complex acid labile subunit [Branchiostoma belcheri]|uniref:Insulin-like growth factor-binding protein complex acid labile subunit n=1 Tax=Branchiostoma belcheri TaxID=7741 RepID=A0A6P4YYC3_BRABE|nr:PREDICTED: insulin-like growth factor-binding protein complex acid labile subunit [Branchiostoma belcheri]